MPADLSRRPIRDTASRAALMCAAACLTATLLSGCGEEKPEALVSSAKAYFAKNENKAGIIQIKTALQGNPNLPEARYLLGVALLEMGDPASAELELRKALDLKHDENLVVPKLAAAMLSKGEARKLIEEFATSDLAPPSAQADLLTTVSAAHLFLGDTAAADAAQAAALTADPSFVPARLWQARRAAAAGNVDAALQSTLAILVAQPRAFEAWKLKGDLLLGGKNEPQEALEAWRQAAELRTGDLSLHLRIATTELQLGQLTAVDKELEQIRKLAPNHPEMRYLQAQLGLVRHDLKAAREASQQLLKLTPESAKALQLAGVIELEARSLARAESLLKKALQVAPQLSLARKALIQTYLLSGQPASALSTLTAAAVRGELPSDLYAVAGEVYLHNADPKRAEEYFAKSLKLDPQDNQRRTSLAVASLLNGEVEAGFGQLQDIAASDKAVTADLALISAHLRRQEFDKALDAIQGLEKKQPDKPLAALLRGRIYLAQRKADAARSSFEAALRLDPGYFPALASLAAMDVSDKKPELAKKRFEALLAKDPANSRALLSLAELANASGSAPAEVADLIGKAVAAHPDDASPHLALIEHRIRQREFKQAVLAANNGLAALPDNPRLLDALGRAQAAAGEFNQASASFNQLAVLQPRTVQPLLRLAEVNMAASQPAAAMQNLRKALELKPDLLEAQRALVLMDIRAERYSEALATAKSIQAQRPAEALGYALEGDVLAAQRRWEASVLAYRSGLKLEPSGGLAFKLYVALLESGKPSEAEGFSLGWQKSHPRDLSFWQLLGDRALTQRDYVVAEKCYLAILQIEPERAVILNNLAWVSNALNKSSALAYAEKANSLSPNQPAFLDTWALILSQDKQYAKAIEIQSQALRLQPDNPMMKLALARIYIQSGDKLRAKEHLTQIARLGDRFAAQEEVSGLLKGL